MRWRSWAQRGRWGYNDIPLLLLCVTCPGQMAARRCSGRGLPRRLGPLPLQIGFALDHVLLIKCPVFVLGCPLCAATTEQMAQLNMDDAAAETSLWETTRDLREISPHLADPRPANTVNVTISPTANFPNLMKVNILPSALFTPKGV